MVSAFRTEPPAQRLWPSAAGAAAALAGSKVLLAGLATILLDHLRELVLRELEDYLADPTETTSHGNAPDSRADKLWLRRSSQVPKRERHDVSPCLLVAITQPFRYIGVALGVASVLYTPHQRKRVPVRNAPRDMHAQQVGNSRIGRSVHVALVMKLLPKLLPRSRHGAPELQIGNGRARVKGRAVSAVQISPSGISKGQHDPANVFDYQPPAARGRSAAWPCWAATSPIPAAARNLARSSWLSIHSSQ